MFVALAVTHLLRLFARKAALEAEVASLEILATAFGALPVDADGGCAVSQPHRRVHFVLWLAVEELDSGVIA
jgi:hypothetical protein